MVLPFALALAVGSYLSILSLCSLYLCHVHAQLEKATIQWFDLGDDFHFAFTMLTVAFTMLTVAFDLTTATAAMSARQIWDPGIGCLLSNSLL